MIQLSKEQLDAAWKEACGEGQGKQRRKKPSIDALQSAILKYLSRGETRSAVAVFSELTAKVGEARAVAMWNSIHAHVNPAWDTEGRLLPEIWIRISLNKTGSFEWV